MSEKTFDKNIKLTLHVKVKLPLYFVCAKATNQRKCSSPLNTYVTPLELNMVSKSPSPHSSWFPRVGPTVDGAVGTIGGRVGTTGCRVGEGFVGGLGEDFLPYNV